MEHTRINKGLVTREDAGKTIMPVGHKWPDYHGAMDARKLLSLRLGAKSVFLPSLLLNIVKYNSIARLESGSKKGSSEKYHS